MLSIKKNFLFIHVPKTGGNSLQRILHGYSEDELITITAEQDGIERFEVRNPDYVLYKHATLQEYRAVLPPHQYTALYKFATLRNPWDMMISWYFSPHRQVQTWDRQQFIELLDVVQPWRYYICQRAEPLVPSSQRAQGEGAIAGESSGSLVQDIDFLLRFERLEADFHQVCAAIGLPPQPLPRVNRSHRDHYSTYYDDELKAMVEKKFTEEIDFGGYRF
jgi:hypothetical protein